MSRPLRKFHSSMYSQRGFSRALKDFKSLYCDENRLIAEALATTLKSYLRPPILDVGAGLGDIAETAFPEMAAVLLDLNDIPARKNPRHQRVVCNFFDYDPKEMIRAKTLLLAHVLQYLDDDTVRLANKVAELNPDIVITVLNDNTDIFGDIMEWSLEAIEGANPEMKVEFLDPTSYRCTKTVPIRAVLHCPNFDVMAYHFVDVLIDAPKTNQSLAVMRKKLTSLMSTPQIIINQTIYCYEKA